MGAGCSCLRHLVVAVGLMVGGPQPVRAESLETSAQVHILPFYERTLLATPGPVPRPFAVPRDAARLHIRPNFEARLGAVSVLFRPRVTGAIEWYRDDFLHYRALRGDVFVNEWRLQVAIGSHLFLSYGREVLQWGMALFVSPSNPFFLATGRANPELELGGRDFFKAIAVLTDRLTSSVIVNTAVGRGARQGVPFRPILLWKLDYVDDRWEVALLASAEHLGGQALGWSASAVLFESMRAYTEGALSRSPRGLYPVRAPSSGIGWEMQPIREQQSARSIAGLAGLAYTFGFGTTIQLEYLLHEEGFTSSQARAHAELILAAGAAAQAPDPALSNAAVSTLGQALAPNLRALRRHYLSVQATHLNLFDDWDVFLRYVQNLDDGSGLFAPVLEWNACERSRVFAIAAISTGKGNDEFGAQLRRYFMTGVRFFLL